MKFGNFVGDNSLEFTADERDNFRTFMETLIYKHNLPFNVSVCRIEGCNIYKGAKTNNVLVITLTWNRYDHLHDVRNHNRDLISVDGPITFRFNKSSGYLDETDWLNIPLDVFGEERKKFLKHNYKDAPAFQYSCHTLSGIHYKKFRHRTWLYLNALDYFGERIPPYFYGTEFNDMEDEIVTYLKALIKFVN